MKFFSFLVVLKKKTDEREVEDEEWAPTDEEVAELEELANEMADDGEREERQWGLPVAPQVALVPRRQGLRRRLTDRRRRYRPVFLARLF